MLKRRIIPVLLLRNGRMVKGKQFANYRDTGDPVSAAKIYNHQKADELAFIDIDASVDGRMALLSIIEKAATECFMPLTVGGGVSSVEDVRDLLNAGADKVLINTASVENPELIAEAADIFGKQCIVAGIDVKLENNKYQVYTHCSKTKVDITPTEQIKKMEKFGAGEIFINSIDRDGMMDGYDEDLVKMISSVASIPVIACGGAGNFQHLADALQHYGAHAVACASLFHFGDNNPIRARSFLKNAGIPVKQY